MEITRRSPIFHLFETRSLVTPNGVDNIRLTVEYMAFIGVWRSVFQYTLPSTSRCFDVYGTVFLPQWTPRNC